MLSTFTSYTMIAKDLTRSLSLKAAETTNARETEYYLENIGNIKSIDDFMADKRIYNYAMKAFGLDDMAYAKGYIRKVLTEGVADTDSLANRVLDERFKRLAKTFDFEAKGEEATQTEDAKQGVVDRYVRQALENDAGEDNTGVRLALYFERMAPEINSAYDILADEALSEFVRTTFGLPEEMASQDIDKQAATVAKVLDVKALQDPQEVTHLIQRFTVMYDVENDTATDPILNLFSTTTQASISDDLLYALQKLKHGG
jgi:hypothetical protein